MTRLHTILVAVTVLVAVGIAPAAANPGSDAHGDEDDDTGLIDKIRALASGLSDRAGYFASSLTGSEEANATADAEAVIDEWNQHEDAYLAYFNARTTADSEYDVLKVTFDRDGSTETIYLVADVNSTSGDYERAEMVWETDRTPDESVTLSGFASDNASDELQTFREKFVEPDSDVTGEYDAELAGKYWGQVDKSFEV